MPASYADLMGQWDTALNTQINTPPNAEHFGAVNTIMDLNQQMYGLGQYAGQGPATGAAEYWGAPAQQLPAVTGSTKTPQPYDSWDASQWWTQDMQNAWSQDPRATATYAPGSAEAQMQQQDLHNWASTGVNPQGGMGPQLLSSLRADQAAHERNQAKLAAQPPGHRQQVTGIAPGGLPPGAEAPWTQPGWLNTPQSVAAFGNFGQSGPTPAAPAQSPAFTGQPPGNAGPRMPNNWGMDAAQALSGGGRANYTVPAWLKPMFGGAF